MPYYIIHGTLTNNLVHILRDGYIDNNPKKTTFVKSAKQIFTQLVYKNIPYEKDQIPFWFDSCIVLDKKILLDYAFYANGIGFFKDKFIDGLNSQDSIIANSTKLQKYPNLRKLKNYINNKKILLGNTDFIHSHEILFGKKILLKKYCVCIIIYSDNSLLNKIQKLCNDLKIPLKILNRHGINNFIDLINN